MFTGNITQNPAPKTNYSMVMAAVMRCEAPAHTWNWR